jgi:hypothetical protein
MAGMASVARRGRPSLVAGPGGAVSATSRRCVGAEADAEGAGAAGDLDDGCDTSQATSDAATRRAAPDGSTRTVISSP